jgi:hypothetical protein
LRVVCARDHLPITTHIDSPPTLTHHPQLHPSAPSPPPPSTLTHHLRHSHTTFNTHTPPSTLTHHLRHSQRLRVTNEKGGPWDATRSDERGGTGKGRAYKVRPDGAQMRREGGNPFSVVFLLFLSAQTRREGGNPFSVVFLFTQTRREGGNPFFVVFLSAQTRREGGNPFSVVFLFPQTR